MEQFFHHLIEEFQLPLRNPVLVFSLMLFIILLSPILLRRLKIPAIIGLIISGVIIGPHALGLIGIKTMESEGSIKLFSTIGLLYIMFIAGLELDLNDFRKHLRKSVVFGALTFFIPITLGYPICRYVLELNETASLLTASMFATHTLVAYPIISKFGLTKNSAVALAVGGTILTDTAVLIILAIISSSTRGNLDSVFWFSLLTSLTIFTLIMFLIVPRVAKWFFSKLESESNAQYIFVLSVVFFAAFLAEVAGVEHIIGAFAAGLVLNKLIPHSSSLMNRIDFIGNTLFIPFFLIYVGMVVDYKVLFDGTWALVIAGVLTTFAIFSKWLAAWVTQLIFKMSVAERQVIFGLSTAHAAATLAIIMVGYENEILSIQIVNGTIVLILITCMVASFVAENAGKRMLIEQAGQKGNDLPETKLRHQHLMLAINQLKGNERLLDFALLITDKKVINPISVVSVLPDDEVAERMIRGARRHLDEIVRHFSGADAKVNAMATIDHNLSSGIARVSKELVADIVVLNDSRRMDLIRRIVGDDRNHLLDVCDKMIFFCSLDHSPVLYKRIVLVAPPLAEIELSFALWAERILRLANELDLPVDVYASAALFQRWKKIAAHNRFGGQHKLIEMNDTDDFFVLHKERSEKDLVVCCAARSGGVSHTQGIENFLTKIDKAFTENDTIVIYPSQKNSENLYSKYEDFDANPISIGMEKLQRLGKEVKNVFKTEE
jgi:Kef-type K+ transport system membrane component KefB